MIALLRFKIGAPIRFSTCWETGVERNNVRRKWITTTAFPGASECTMREGDTAILLGRCPHDFDRQHVLMHAGVFCMASYAQNMYFELLESTSD